MKTGRHTLRYFTSRPPKVWHTVLSEAEAEKIVEGFLFLHRAEIHSEDDLDRFVIQVQALLNWCVHARLAQTTLDLAFKNCLVLDWSMEKNDVCPVVTEVGRLAT